MRTCSSESNSKWSGMIYSPKGPLTLGKSYHPIDPFYGPCSGHSDLDGVRTDVIGAAKV